ncbi:MAG TPA: hypothetical protein VFH56_17165 [Acidimicrobiales bacterium]|nr:hypothetical protein [Acidimicrobiales bacterium]
MWAEGDWSLWHRMRECSSLCRLVAPLDLKGRACYTIPAELMGEEVPKFDPSIGAWVGITWLQADSECQPWLSKHGEWKGPGFGCLLKPPASAPPEFWAAIAMHELGHWLAGWPVRLPQTASDRFRAEVAAYSARVEDAGRLATDAARYIVAHHYAWLRAMLHLQHRAMAGGCQFPLEFLMALEHLSALEDYRAVLWPELESRSPEESIIGILESPPPADFAWLWARDVVRIHSRKN